MPVIDRQPLQACCGALGRRHRQADKCRHADRAPRTCWPIISLAGGADMPLRRRFRRQYGRISRLCARTTSMLSLAFL